jgi:hypothetical protein
VVVLTLVVQGLLLPNVVRWAQLPADTGISDELDLARTTAVEEALGALPDIAAKLGTAAPVVSGLTQEYQEHLRVMDAERDGDDDESSLQLRAQYRALRLALIGQKRETVLRLRDERRIDNTVLRQIQRTLDIEEERLSRQRDDE